MLFNSRETYIAAVKNWKQSYKELSERIRTNKVGFRATESKLDRAQYGDSDRATLVDDLWRLRSSLLEDKQTANNMLVERAEGKIEAQRQYIEEKATNDMLKVA